MWVESYINMNEDVSSSVRVLDLRFDHKDSVQLRKLYSNLNIDSFKKNILVIEKENNSANFINQIHNGYLKLLCPINSTLARCQHSIPVGNINFLYFKGVEPFYIIQDNFCIEAFYYPISSTFIVLKGCLDHKRKIKVLLNLILEKSNELEKYYAKETKFDGIYCFHQSPYHYYYFKVSVLLPAINKAALHGLTVYSLSGKAFLELSEVTNNIKSDSVLIQMHSIYDQINSSSFSLSIGEHTKKLTNQDIQMCDAKVANQLAKYAIKNEIVSQILNFKQTHFILWIGISSGKRTWVEQVEGYKQLIESLLSSVGRLVVIIDGWTRGKGYAAEVSLYSQDKRLADELVGNFNNNNLQFINLVGETAPLKASIALYVDFFIANHGTGSMWVSRVAAAKGVTHISNIARQAAINDHIHPNAELLPKKYIFDIEDENADTAFHVSYSINPNDFSRYVLPVALEEYNKKIALQNSKKLFNKLQFSSSTKPADALRDIAVAFDKIGDRKTAYKLMEKALEQRPNGPFIKQKIGEWKKLSK